MIGKERIRWLLQQNKEGIFFAIGCEQRNCPCEMWINCRQYGNNKWENIHPEQFDEELHEWYDTNFRIKYEHGENIGNG